jgi:hypothetical protein
MTLAKGNHAETQRTTRNFFSFYQQQYANKIYTLFLLLGKTKYPGSIPGDTFMCTITVRMELNKSNYSSMYINLVEGTVQLDFLLLFCMNELHLTPFLVSESLPNFASNSRRHSRFSFDSRESTPPDHLVRRVTAFFFFSYQFFSS